MIGNIQTLTRKKGNVDILMTDKMDFKARSIATHKRETLVKINRSIQPENFITQPQIQ